MKRNKILVLVLVVALSLSTLSVLSGCAQSTSTPTPTSTAPPSPTSTAPPPPPPVPKVTIALWEQMDPGEKTLLTKNITTFTEAVKAQYAVTFDIVHYGTEDLRSNFQTAALAGSGPDIVYGPNDNVGPFSTLNLIKPLDDVFGAAFWGKFMPNAVDSMKLNGKIWAMPDRVGNHLMLIYNKTLVPTPPTNSDEMIAMGKALYKEEGGKPVQWGVVWNTQEPFFHVPWLGGFGGWVMDDKSQPTLGSQGMIDSLAFGKMLLDELVSPVGADYNIAESLFKTGQAGMIINGDWALGGYKTDITGFQWGVTRIPMIVATGNWPTPMVSSKGYSINVKVKPEVLPAVKAFLEFMATTAIQSQWVRDLSILPSLKEAMQDPIITSDPILKGSAYQVETGKPMPTVPEMRAIWDSYRPSMQGVFGGQLTPAEAAPKMQSDAVAAIAAMTQ